MDNFKLRVIKAQAALRAPKNQRNNFGGYNYRSCEDILEAAKPICAANNLLLTIQDDIVLIGERYYIKATASLLDTESDSNLSVSAFARESKDKKGMDDSQITGASSSYARKYALNGLFCIDDNKDADTDEFAQNAKKEAQTEEAKKPIKADVKQNMFVCNKCGNKLVPYLDNNGKEIGIRQHAAGSEKKFGQVLCLDCIRELYPDTLNFAK